MKETKKPTVVYFTKYSEKGPSSRYRSFQYFDSLRSDFEIICFPLFNDRYISDIYSNQSTSKFQIIVSYIKRIYKILTLLGTKNILFIEYELLPYFPPIFEFLLKKTKVRIVFDYDDAIFHNYDQHRNPVIRFLFKSKILSLAKYSSHIITGSPYLTDYFKPYKAKVTEIPTSISYLRYENLDDIQENNKVIIGWLGSKTTSINLLIIKNAIFTLIKNHPELYFDFMGFNEKLEPYFKSENISFSEWSTNKELTFLKSIDVGIMPLERNFFNKGKCGFKLIQYMAAGKPTISTPLQANIKINRSNGNLFAESEEEWIQQIKQIISNPKKFAEIGNRNKEIIKEFYSVEANSKAYTKLFKRLQNVRY